MAPSRTSLRVFLAVMLLAAPVFTGATRPLAAPAARRSLTAAAASARPPFDWGVATAAYQIEGAAREGGRSPSVWDTFSNDAAAVGDDFYNKYPEDIELMTAMGVKKFRMSLSWPRIIPSATGEPSAEGLAFYHRVIDALLAAGIEPWVTTYHWDLPQSLQDKYGGWASPAVVDDYARYAALVFKEFGGKVKNWSTFNEPRTFCTLGYGVGVHAPGIKSVEQTWQCVQHVLEGHAKAAKAFRASVPGGKLSMNLDGEWGEPLTDSPADVEAAQIHRDYHYGLFADPLYLGKYPDSVLKHAPPGLGQITPELAAALKGSMDLFSFNAYTTRYVKASPGANNPEGLGLANYETLEQDAKGAPLGPVADSSWLIVTPWGFRKALAYLNNRYKPGEMAVTENGVSVPQEDSLPFPAVLHDQFRVDFYDSYLKAASDAVREDGVPLKTYFAWSLLDNFEWADGFAKRFGITYVDYKDGQKRYPKDSFKFLSNLWGGGGGATLPDKFKPNGGADSEPPSPKTP